MACTVGSGVISVAGGVVISGVGALIQPESSRAVVIKKRTVFFIMESFEIKFPKNGEFQYITSGL